MPDLDALYNAIEAAAETAYGGDGELSTERAAAIDAYLGRNTKPAPDGRSQATDRSVYETIQWMLPSLSRIFANGDDVVDLPPVGPEDEAGAKQEAQYLNYLVLQRNNWFETFTTAAKDALLTKGGYLYAYRDKRRQVELEHYERQTAEGLALIQQDKPEILNLREYPDPDHTPQPVIDPQTQQPVMGPEGPLMEPPLMLYDFDVRRVEEEQKYCLDALPPERCRISDKHRAVQLVGCPYFEYQDWVPLSDLRAEGIDVPDDAEGGEDPDSTAEDASRNRFVERSEETALDPSMRRVLTRWVWIQHDYDEDGIAELNYCIIVGREVVHREECNEIPVAVLCPDPLPHRHAGLAVADTVLDIQEIKTAILRQGLDNLYLSNNPRQFADPNMVNLDDVLVSRPGGVVRTRNGAIFGQHFGSYEVPFVFDKAMAGMEYMDQIRENRTGTNRYFTGIDQNALNKTATGIQQLSTMAAQRVEQIARHFSNGIEQLFAILHALVLKGGHQKEVVKLRGEWVQVDPATWRKRTDFRISVGYAAGNKDAMISRLVMIAQFQEKAIAAGLPIVQPQNVYETMLELIKASDFSSPERFVTDPAKAPQREPQPDPQVQIEQMKAEKDKQIKAAELQQREGESQRQHELEKYKADLDSQTKLAVEQLHAQAQRETEEFRAQHGVALKQFEGEQSLTAEEHKARLQQEAKASEQAPAIEMAGQVQQLAEKLEGAIGSLQDALATVLTAKRQIRRGKDGRAEGVDVVGPDGSIFASQSVVRGPDGRVAGTQ